VDLAVAEVGVNDLLDVAGLERGREWQDQPCPAPEAGWGGVVQRAGLCERAWLVYCAGAPIPQSLASPACPPPAAWRTLPGVGAG